MGLKFYRKKRRTLICTAAIISTVFTNVAGISGGGMLVRAEGAETDYSEDNATFITFFDTEATASGLEDGYSIKGTSVTVSAAGTYVFSGSCSDGSITVKKGTTGARLVLNGLDLTSISDTTGPILCKASTETEIVAEEGTVNNLSDSVANAEEKAAIKVNKQSDLVLSGTGTLNVSGLYKNGIKGGAETDITVKEQTLNIKSADNGLASDNTVTVESGKLTIEAGGDGIKSSPDRVDDEGNPDDTESLGNIILEGGEISIHSAADGIQGDNDVTIQGGSYQITTNDGHTTKLAEDADSCKGIKAESALTINGGDFIIDSADDALHSNEYISVMGGTFSIQTGDDGMHADTSLIIGSEEEPEESDIDIFIQNSYEGLEAGTVYVNSGTVVVNSTDDGVNAAGGNDGSGSNGIPGDGFKPWGGGPGGRPGGRAAESSEYAIHINGGTLYVKAAGDGLDANGDLYISGGNITVYGAAAGGQGSDNFPFDHDGTFAITGGYIFGAGSSQMEEKVNSSTQGYIVNRSSYNQGTVVNVTDSQGNVLFTETLAERVNYMMYSSPEMTTSGSYSFKTGTLVGQINISECQITLAQNSYTYDGTEKRPAVTVTYGGKTLTGNVDYTITYNDNINVGTAKATITGMGNYTGTGYREFEILENEEGNTNPGEDETTNPGGTTNPEEDETINPGEDETTNPGEGETTTPGGTTPGGTTNPGEDETTNPGEGETTTPGETTNLGEDENPEAETSEKPAQVTGVRAAAVSASGIKISWKKIADADGYLIDCYDSSKKAWKCIKTISRGTTTSYTNKGLASGKTYKYRVSAYKTENGNKVSGSASKTVTAATNPAKGSIKKATASKNSIILKWKKTAGSGYEITYSTKKNFSNAQTIKVSGASKLTYTIKKLKSKRTYYVKIRAYLKVGGKVYRGAYSAKKAIRVN